MNDSYVVVPIYFSSSYDVYRTKDYLKIITVYFDGILKGKYRRFKLPSRCPANNSLNNCTISKTMDMKRYDMN